jgi:hypothetical protein
MSGAVVGQGKDGAFHLFSDGAVFNAKGDVTAIAQKTLIFAPMVAAMVVLGPVAFAAALYADASYCQTFDLFLENVVGLLRGYYRISEIRRIVSRF